MASCLVRISRARAPTSARPDLNTVVKFGISSCNIQGTSGDLGHLAFFRVASTPWPASPPNRGCQRSWRHLSVYFSQSRLQTFFSLSARSRRLIHCDTEDMYALGHNEFFLIHPYLQAPLTSPPATPRATTSTSLHTPSSTISPRD